MSGSRRVSPSEVSCAFDKDRVSAILSSSRKPLIEAEQELQPHGTL
jgi:hypothetical protein